MKLPVMYVELCQRMYEEISTMGATERKTAVDMVPNYGITYAGAACPMADYAGAGCAEAAVSTCTVAMNPRKYARLIFEYFHQDDSGLAGVF